MRLERLRKGGITNLIPDNEEDHLLRKLIQRIERKRGEQTAHEMHPALAELEALESGENYKAVKISWHSVHYTSLLTILLKLHILSA